MTRPGIVHVCSECGRPVRLLSVVTLGEGGSRWDHRDILPPAEIIAHPKWWPVAEIDVLSKVGLGSDR